MTTRPCKKCASIFFKIEEVEFRNGTKHLKRLCLECGAFIDYAAQEIPHEMFIMPFGRFKGEPIYKMVEEDMRYSKWFLNNVAKGSVKDRLAKTISDFNASKTS